MQIKQFSFIYIKLFVLIINSSITVNTTPFVLILDPAGDVNHTGRKIDDVFERGITLQCAEKIKLILEKDNHDITVFITRLPGDTVYELQNAAFANRLNADLFISINFHQIQEARPTLDIYTFSYGDTFMHQSNHLAFYTYDTAHIKQNNRTNNIVDKLAQQLQNSHYNSLFSVTGPHAIPLKQIIGLCPASIVIDAGLKDKAGWNYYVEPLAHAIITTLNQSS